MGDCVTSVGETWSDNCLLLPRIRPRLQNVVRSDSRTQACAHARTHAGGSLNSQLLSRDLKTGNNCGGSAHGAATHGCTTPSQAAEESLTPSCSRPTAARGVFLGRIKSRFPVRSGPPCRTRHPGGAFSEETAEPSTFLSKKGTTTPVGGG